MSKMISSQEMNMMGKELYLKNDSCRERVLASLECVLDDVQQASCASSAALNTQNTQTLNPLNPKP